MEHLKILEFDKILSLLSERAVTETVKKRCLELAPTNAVNNVKRGMEETTQAKIILEKTGQPPLAVMTELRKTMAACSADVLLTPEQIGEVASFLLTCRRMKNYLKRAETTGSQTALYGDSILELNEMEEEINRCIRNNRVDDKASQRLFDLRRSIIGVEEQIKDKLTSMLRRNKEFYAEGFVALRNGRYTLPVKKDYKNRVEGLTVDLSNTGGTYFIEPASVRKLQDSMTELFIEEDAEVRRILYSLGALIYENLSLISLNIEAMETLDFLFAKAKLSADMKANPVRLTDERQLRVLSAKHPLLDYETAVPLDFMLGGGISGVIITGPNTGGKTVALKTVGLLSAMVLCGLHVPADERSVFCSFNTILCDIGDGQSISENLSTFSSHLTNILGILQKADENSLVLLDELGSGTDPAEGMGIAVSILEELRSLNCLFAATTHYPEIKEYAGRARGLINARMAFDKENLSPLYRLEIGEAGESCALYIAERLGMPPHMLKRAYDASYSGLKQSLPTEIEKNGIITVKPLDITENTEEKAKPTPPRSQRFNIGDCVIVYPQKETGIVYAAANEKGEIGVQIKGRKKLVGHKRIKLKVAAEKLYPDNYDMSIVLDSVANRKARHLMDKKHVDGNIIVIKEGKDNK